LIGKNNMMNIPAKIGDDNSLIMVVATIATTNNVSNLGNKDAIANPSIIAAKVIGKMSPPRQFRFRHHTKKINFKTAMIVKNSGDL